MRMAQAVANSLHACSDHRLGQCRHSTSKPAVVRALEDTNIVQVAAGGWHCLAVTAEGKIYAWGGNEYFQCGVDAGALTPVANAMTMQPGWAVVHEHCCVHRACLAGSHQPKQSLQPVSAIPL